MEIWDGYFRDGTLANVDLIRGEQIPSGIYHLVCGVLVMHVSGDYLLMQRDISKPNYGGYYEATAGGSALKGENEYTCIRRELLEETGILADKFEKISVDIEDDKNCIFYSFLCITDCEKDSIKLQQGETMSYKWISEKEFIHFIHSGKMIDRQKRRYFNYFKEKGFII